MTPGVPVTGWGLRLGGLGTGDGQLTTTNPKETIDA